MNNKILLRLMIPENYPFKPYKIYYHDLANNYDMYLSKININKKFDPKVLYFFYICMYGAKAKFLKLNDNECYCCNSFTCYTNWSPALTVTNVLLEYNEVAFIKKYSNWYNYIYLENIHSSLNHFNKLPDDIIEIIFENLI
jgi:ubiquitin-protein ligase